MLPVTITKIHQAFKEIKHMAMDTWQEECRFASRSPEAHRLKVIKILRRSKISGSMKQGFIGFQSVPGFVLLS